MNPKNDMTQGPILPQLVRFALPLLFTCILQQSYSLADAVIIQRLAGLDGFTAIGATGALLWMIESMLMGLSQGFAVVFAQMKGNDQEKDFLGATAIRAGQMAVAMAFLSSVCIFLFSDTILAAFHTPAEILPQASAYLKSMTPFLCMAALYQTTAALLRACGNSAFPLKAMLVSTLLNIVLDFVLIRFAKLGVAGAGIATSIAQGAAFWLCSRKCPSCAGALPAGTTVRLLKMGLPSMIRNGMIASSGGVVQSLINQFGVHVIAGVAASKKFFTLLQMCSSALEGTTATYVGQNTGAQQYERLRKGLHVIFVLTVLSSLMTAVLTFILSRGMIQLLLGSEHSMATASGIRALRWAAVFLPSLYLLCVMRAALQNMGHAGISMFSGFLEVGGRIVAVAALPVFIGETTVYIAEEIGWAITAVYLMICYSIQIRKAKERMIRSS